MLNYYWKEKMTSPNITPWREDLFGDRSQLFDLFRFLTQASLVLQNNIFILSPLKQIEYHFLNDVSAIFVRLVNV